MEKLMPNLGFQVMCFLFKIRDSFRPREEIFKEVEIKSADKVLDFGCGPGSYSIIASKLVGDSGKIYALDIHPLAVKKVNDKAKKTNLTNIETICSDCSTDLQEKSIDVILLYDIFHMLKNPKEILKELHRVLKNDGFLSFSDHHMKEEEIVTQLTTDSLFKFVEKRKFTYKFTKK